MEDYLNGDIPHLYIYIYIHYLYIFYTLYIVYTYIYIYIIYIYIHNIYRERESVYIYICTIHIHITRVWLLPTCDQWDEPLTKHPMFIAYIISISGHIISYIICISNLSPVHILCITIFRWFTRFLFVKNNHKNPWTNSYVTMKTPPHPHLCPMSLSCVYPINHQL